MSSASGPEPLRFQPIPRAGLAILSGLQLDHAARFLEPLPEIVAAIRRGPAHRLVGVLARGTLAGFYVLHPDRRDSACWWLGWLAIDARFQGAGLGRAALAAALASLRRLQGCRRIRLLVAADNAPALALYRRAGFAVVGCWPSTGELVMQRRQPPSVAAEIGLDRVLHTYSLIQAMWLRLWRRGAPFAARLSGEFHGPPGAIVAA